MIPIHQFLSVVNKYSYCWNVKEQLAVDRIEFIQKYKTSFVIFHKPTLFGFFGNIIIKTINTYTQNKYKAWLAWYRTIILAVNRDSSKIKVTIAKLQISIITGIKWELIQKSLPTNKVKVKLQIQILFEIRCTCTYISHGGSVQFHCKWTRILMLYGTRKFFNSMQ